MATVADFIVSELRVAGTHTLFGVPGGGSNLDLIAAAGRAGLPFVLTSTETGAAIAAMAQAEITGHPGACLTTLGPGAASVVNGVACACLERAPVLVFTDTQSDVAAACEHQRLDQHALLAPLSVWSGRLTPQNVRQTMADALTAAGGRPAGPVHIDCPGDAAGAEMSHERPPEATRRTAPQMVAPRPSTHFEQLVSRARKPLLLVGLGARRIEDAVAIRRLCERRRVPALVTYKAKGVVPDHHEWFAGVLTNAAIEQPVLAESDLLIGVGLDPVELLPRAWTHPSKVVYAGPWTVSDTHVPWTEQLVSEVPAVAEWLGDALPRSDWDLGRVRLLVDAQRQAIRIATPGFSAHRVVEVAAVRLAPIAGRVTVDAGAHMLPATLLWPVSEPNRLLISNGLSTMGFALPAAIGAALVDRDRPVVALTGDGGLLMCLAELLTAVRENLRLIVIVFSDASLSLIEIKQQARRLAPAGVALGAIDWPALARSFGARAWAADSEQTLDGAVEQAIGCSGPCLIEAKIDRSNYGAMLRAVRG